MSDKSVQTTLFVPMRQYFRPHGQSTMGHLVIADACTPKRLIQLEWIATEHIEFTIEVLITGAVNLCMDNGDFDYKYMVVAPEQVNTTVLELIDNFDLQDYRRLSATIASD
jgi:hypothetical protein